MPDPFPSFPTDEIARKWRLLAQRRRAHLSELHESGNWRRYYTDEAFLTHMRETVRNIDVWDSLSHGAKAPRDEPASESMPPRAIADAA